MYQLKMPTKCLIKNPYKCALCTQGVYKNANGIVQHVKKKHTKQYSFEQYYIDFITVDLFKNICAKKILTSPFNINTRLTKECFECKEETCSYMSFSKGFSVFCSQKCSSENTLLNRSRTKRAKKANYAKYGAPAATVLKKYKNKIADTKLQKYGDAKFCNHEKAKITNKKKYGTAFYTQTKEYKEKLKKTCLEKYGVEHFTKLDVTKEKSKKTCLEKYGVEFYSQTNSHKEKTKKTCLEKYGVNSFLETKKCKEMAYDVFQQKFGGYPMENEKILTKIQKTLQKKFLLRLSKKAFEHIEIASIEKKTFKCLYCKDVFSIENISLNKRTTGRYPRCFSCFPTKQNTSIGEQQVYKFIKSILPNNIVVKQNFKGLFTDSKQEVDIYIPEKSIAIEYNGLYWHSEINGRKQRKYHINKTLHLWHKHKIQLIHIFSDDWETKTDIIRSILSYKLHANKINKKIRPRQCNILFVNKNSNKNILQEMHTMYLSNHLQGSPKKSSEHIVAFHNEKIVAAMSFCLYPKRKTIELDRFCTERDSNIPGIGGKLLKSFLNNVDKEKFKNIFSFADISMSNLENNLYKNLGFTEIKRLGPRYWYLDKNFTKRHHRFLYRRKRLKTIFLRDKFNPKLTEWENMHSNGFDRIWDCGIIKYEKSI